jgi:FkbM family methyltransferase
LLHVEGCIEKLCTNNGVNAMDNLKLIPGLFRSTPLSGWFLLGGYLFGRALHKSFGIRPFSEMVLRFNGFSFCVGIEGASGLAFLHEILVRRVYDCPPLNSGTPGRVVFDVGANCGLFSLTRCLHHPTLRAYCFEPHPVTVRWLQKNIAVNRLEPRMTAVHAAVGAATGECKLNISPESSMGVVTTSTARCLDHPSEITVAMVSLDDFAAQEGIWPDIMKIDVEGCEADVLRGSTQCLRHTQLLIMEYHSLDLRAECHRLLQNSGFTIQEKAGLLFCFHGVSPGING